MRRTRPVPPAYVQEGCFPRGFHDRDSPANMARRPPRQLGQGARHVPPAGMWWSGIGGQVVPGAPCGCLRQSPGHELLLRLGRTQVRPRCQDRGRGPGMWWFCFEAQVVPGNDGGPGCCCRGMNCTARSARMHAPTLPGWGRGPGMWWFCFEAQLSHCPVYPNAGCQVR